MKTPIKGPTNANKHHKLPEGTAVGPLHLCEPIIPANKKKVITPMKYI
jgi:hypothetical protein